MPDPITSPAIQEKGYRDSCLGTVLYIRIFTNNYRQLTWTEIWECFADSYPDQWALQVFPPASDLVDQENIYHLFVLQQEPTGMNIHPRTW